MVVWQRVSVRVGLFFFWVGYRMGINEVLDFMPKAGTIIGVVAFFLMEVTVYV